jgi:hypothetical protein
MNSIRRSSFITKPFITLTTRHFTTQLLPSSCKLVPTLSSSSSVSHTSSRSFATKGIDYQETPRPIPIVRRDTVNSIEEQISNSKFRRHVVVWGVVLTYVGFLAYDFSIYHAECEEIRQKMIDRMREKRPVFTPKEGPNQVFSKEFLEEIKKK